MSNASPPQPKRPSRGGGWQRGMHEASPYLGLGMQLALSMLFFVLGGYFLDEWLGTTPWLLIVGAVLGMVAIFAHLVRLTTRLARQSKPRSPNDTPDDPPAANA